jgi:hypothetical protein
MINWFGGEESELWGRIVEISDQAIYTFGEIVGFFWIVFSGVTKLSIGHKIFIDHPLQ